MTSRLIFERVEGNVGPDLVTQVEDLDISAVVTITAIVRYHSGKKLEKVAVIDDAAAGLFHVEWAAGDLIKGNHKLEFRFEFATTRVTLPEGEPYLLRVRERV